MKSHIKKTIILVFVFFVSAVCLNIYSQIAGLPWLEIQAKNEMERYLKKIFEQDVKIKYISFSPEMVDYLAIVVVDNSSLEFKIKFVDGKLYNDYFIQYWNKQANEILSNELSYIIGESIQIEFSIDLGLPTFKNGPVRSTPLDKYKMLFDDLPVYEEVKDELLEYSTSRVKILNNLPFLTKRENKILFDIIDGIKKCTPTHQIIIDIDSRESVYLDFEDQQNITSPASVNKYFEK